jgi:hypothetical protein
VNVSSKRQFVTLAVCMCALAFVTTWALNAFDADPNVGGLAILALIVISALIGTRLELPPPR